MTAPTDIDGLIARLESASEGSRKLDALIHWHVFQPRYAALTSELEIEAEGRGFDLDREKCGTVVPFEEYIRYPTAPLFTSSIDAKFSPQPIARKEAA